ncbi:MAG: 23S rRNA (uridine(2552)-2'-O)-methyltransferase RlmE [Gammaproteobacteria bacterium]
MPSRTNSSARWLNEHENDIYVKQARKVGYRSRAAFKLLEIQQKDHILRPGMVVVDLGAAPGGWSQVAQQLLKMQGKIIALDSLAMPPLPGVQVIQGDFSTDSVLHQLRESIDNCPVDLVMSDIAPNMSGIPAVDQPRAIYLAEQALDFALEVLKPNGVFLVKIFQGEGFDQFLQMLRTHFKQVKIRKPGASRARSKELYLLGFNPIH